MTHVGFMKPFLPLLVVLLSTSATETMAIDEPAYQVIAREDEYEIRHYPPMVVVEIEVEGSFEKAGNEAFRPLFDFIAGANVGTSQIEMTAPVTQRQSEKIEMTAPVTQLATGSEKYVVQFVMPEEYSLETVPRPTNEEIRLREEPARTVAVHRYSGTWSETRYRKHLDQLRAALARDHVEVSGDPIWARFNSPFRLWFLRRNEIWLPISE